MPREAYTNPVENLRSYVMVHQGIDQHERIIDVEWIEGVIKQAKVVADLFLSDEPPEVIEAIESLREVLRR